jgi:hypothetical protein
VNGHALCVPRDAAQRRGEVALDAQRSAVQSVERGQVSAFTHPALHVGDIDHGAAPAGMIRFVVGTRDTRGAARPVNATQVTAGVAVPGVWHWAGRHPAMSHLAGWIRRRQLSSRVLLDGLLVGKRLIAPGKRCQRTFRQKVSAAPSGSARSLPQPFGQ